jgi:hypothetical protein
MIYLGVVLLIIGILVAVLVHNQIGVAVAVVGLLLILLGLLLPFSDADAAVLMVPFGPHMARLLRWAALRQVDVADRLDPPRAAEWLTRTMDPKNDPVPMGEVLPISDEELTRRLRESRIAYEASQN